MFNKRNDSQVSGELCDMIRLRIKAGEMVAMEYGDTLSYEEFVDKAEILFCRLLEEAEGIIVA